MNAQFQKDQAHLRTAVQAAIRRFGLSEIEAWSQADLIGRTLGISASEVQQVLR